MATPLHQFEGKYEVLEKIAEGGMGAVYKVRHKLLDVIKVIKVMRPQIEAQEGTRARFLHEARLAIKMRHPNIAQLDDFSMDEDGNAFIVMEYIEGLTLQEYLQKLGAVPPALALEVARQSLLALGYLHRKQVIHRDISPDNLMLAKDESGDPLIKLIDLGIAKALQGESNLTATGMFVGKVRYASPEHFKTEDGAEIDQYSDLYSFGLVLYEMLTGSHPIAGESFSALIAGHLFRPPMDFAKSDPTGIVPEDLRQVVLKSLEKAHEDRYPTAKEFIKALAPVQEQFPMTRAEFEHLFRMTTEELPTLRIRRPGSTQERINGEFPRGVTTPSPSEMTSSETALDKDLTGKTSQLDAVKPSDARTEALLDAARNLGELNLYSEAKVQLSSLLRLDPGNADASQLMAEIERDEKNALELESAVAEGRRLFDAGSFDQALVHVDEALKKYGPNEHLDGLRDDIGTEQKRLRAEAVASLVQAADELLGAEKFDEALVKIEQALLLDPSGAGLNDLRANIAEARMCHEEEQRRSDQVAELISKADACIDGGDHLEAVDKIRQAHSLKPDDHDLALKLKHAEETMRIAEDARERAVILAGHVTNIDLLIASESYAEARKVLGIARAELGNEDELGVVEKRIETAELQWRSARIEGIQNEAQGLLAEGQFKEAIEKLEAGLDFDPDSKALGTQIKDLKRAREAAEKQQEISKATSAVAVLIEQADFSGALKSIDGAVKRLGKHKDFNALRTRVKKAQSEAARQEKVRKKAEAADLKAKKAAAKTAKFDDDIETQPLPKQQRPAVTKTKPLQEPKTKPKAKPKPRPKPRPKPESKKGHSKVVWIAAVVCAVAIAVVAFLALRSGGQPASDPGLMTAQTELVIDASPWAEIVSIVNEAGEEIGLPEACYTPLRITLPVSLYVITLTHPDSGGPVVEEVEIVEGRIARSHTQMLSLSAADVLQRLGVE